MSECKYRASNGECLYQKQFPYIEYCVDGPCPNYTAMTNADHIRAMTDEELAEQIIECVEFEFFRVKVGIRPNNKEEWLEWLEAEAEGEDNG